MKKAVLVVSTIFALTVAGRLVAEDQHKGHMHGTPAKTATEEPAAKKSAPVEDPAAKEPETKKPVYKCPMHPDVTSDKPGKCPKCGMFLKLGSG